MNAPAPGWYPDPQNPQQLRWWDGNEWTTQFAPAAPPQFNVDRGSHGIRSAGDVIAAAFQNSGRRAGHVLAIVLTTSLLPSIVVGLLAWFVIRDVRYDGASWTGVDGSTIALLALALLVTFAGYVLSVGAMTHQLVAEERDTPKSWDTSLRVALARSPRVLGWSLVSILPFFLLFALVALLFLINVALGVLAMVAAVPLAIMIGFFWQFATMAAVTGEKGTNPLGTSYRVVRGRAWAILGRVLLILLVGLGCSFALQIVTIPLGSAVGTSLDFEGAAEFEDAGDDGFAELIRFDGSTLASGALPLVLYVLISAIPNAVITAITTAGLSAIYSDGADAESIPIVV